MSDIKVDPNQYIINKEPYYEETNQEVSLHERRVPPEMDNKPRVSYQDY